MQLIHYLFILSFLHLSFSRSLDKYLEFLDSEITKQLMYPIQDDRNAIYDRINTYNTGLYDVATANAKKAEHAAPIVKALLKKGEPQFTQAPVDFKKLQEVFAWEDIQIAHLKCLMEDTKKLWIKLEKPSFRVSGESKSSFEEGSYM